MNGLAKNYARFGALLVALGFAGSTLADGVKVGQAAPDFALKSADGKEVKLSDLKGKIVVLEWTNPTCPFVKRHHVEKKTTQGLYKDFAAKGVTWLAIDSSNYATAESAAAHAKEHKIDYPILIDADGKTGKAYGAKTTPHMFVIDKEGKIAYMGAMDDDEKGKNANPTNYVKAAVESLLTGSAVATPETKPYGCSVKYKG